MPSHITNLVYENSKHLTSESSLTSVFLLDENTEDETHSALSFGLGVHLRSLVDRVVNFSSEADLFKEKKPVLEFTKCEWMQVAYLPPILKQLRSEYIQIFKEVQEMKFTEDIRNKLGIFSEPWEKYLLLDSEYYLRLLDQNTPMPQWQQVVFLQYVLNSIKEESVSRLSGSMETIRTHFLEFANNSEDKTLKALKTDIDSVEPGTALENLNTNFNAAFNEYLKQQNLLKSYKEDYDSLMPGHAKGESASLPKDRPAKHRSVFQGVMSNMNPLK